VRSHPIAAGSEYIGLARLMGPVQERLSGKLVDLCSYAMLHPIFTCSCAARER
jgi:hypothetical protein